MQYNSNRAHHHRNDKRKKLVADWPNNFVAAQFQR
jgi:hypothetical protein